VVDSHCHLADEAFAADLSAVVQRARDAGLVEALCVVDASDPAEEARASAVCAAWPAVRTTAGVHPHRAGSLEGRAAEAVRRVRDRVAREATVRAIGEIGLDYYYDFSPPAVQREVFAAQVALARALALPVVIHTRDADRDTVDILRTEGQGAVRGVFHCFSGDATLAHAALDLGFHISFSGIVTFPKADSLRAVATIVPDDRLLVETDCPYLAPVPRRGKRNEPAWVVDVSRTLADLRATAAEDVSAIAVANYRRLFAP
jgi:TatD DNase family protein